MSGAVDKYVQERLEESIFSSNPIRKNKAVGHLKRLLREPLRAHEAHDKIKKHADDERLLSQIHHFKKESPDADVRPVLKKRMRELAIQGF